MHKKADEQNCEVLCYQGIAIQDWRFNGRMMVHCLRLPCLQITTKSQTQFPVLFRL